MNRMIISYFREKPLAHILNMFYVGNKTKWESDIIFPKNISCPNEYHLKYEIKVQNKMFLCNGSTNEIILKNGRGEGSKIKDLLKTILKNNFILINGKFPYDIAYADSTKFNFYTF